MKTLARSHCFWCGIDADIEQMVRKCQRCCLVQKECAKAPLHSWEYPASPFQRIDYAGPFMNTNFLVIVDAYSKWPEILPTKNTDTRTTIRILRRTFSRFGIPVTVVSDNGSQFRSAEMERFTKLNGVRHKFTAPYHPASNGQAERYVQMLKRGLRCMADEPGDLDLKLDRLLLQYQNASNSTTGQSPAELMFGRKIRTRLSLLKRDLAAEMNERAPTELTHREFREGDRVQIRSYRNSGYKWEFGTVAARLGLLQYNVGVNRNIRKCHINQMRKSSCESGADAKEMTASKAITTQLPPIVVENTHPPIPLIDQEIRASPEDTETYFSSESTTSDPTWVPDQSPTAQSTPLRRATKLSMAPGF
jgi:Integrase core domain